MKFKKSLLLICLIICIFAVASVSAADANDTAMASEDAGLELSADNEIREDNLQTNEEELMAQANNEEPINVNDNATSQNNLCAEGEGTYYDLIDEIGSGGYKNLTKRIYRYTGGDTIQITDFGVIDGNGAVIDMAESNIEAFYVSAYGVIIKNLTIKNVNFYTVHGGAISFYSSGTVINCNFINNHVNGYGGAIYFPAYGEVINCTFINNTAYDGGAVFFLDTGDVTNCNFIGNTAERWGGAVRFNNKGNITNCNFTDNSASRGGAIYSRTYYTTADTCIFKTNSGENVNTVIYSPTLNIDNFTTFYGYNRKLTFDLKTNSNISVTNGKVSIRVYYKNNNTWIGNYSFLSGGEWTVDLPVGSYYAIFDTEYAEFQPINRTIEVMPYIQFYVNVTSITTYNKTVNITAISNIPNELLRGKLLFALPYNNPITANYAGNGIWWAVHMFDYYGVYEVNATYIGVNNVPINNATITINKAHSTITLDNIVLDYGDSIKVDVKTGGALAITAMVDGEATGVVNYAIPISGLSAGIHTLTVTTIPDIYYSAVTKTVNITVNKVDSTLAVGDIVFDYNGVGSAAVSFTGAAGVDVSVVVQPDAKVNVAGNTITVSGLSVGTYNLTVTTIADANHNNVTKTATITVNKLKTELKASAISTTYNINKDLVITLSDAKGNPLSGVIINVNLGSGKFTTDRNGQVKINVANLVPKTYAVKITFNGDANYAKSTKDVKVTVAKAAPKLTAAKKTFKKSVKTKKYTVTLKTNLNKVMKNTKVTLKVKGKTYKATTNAKGKATFKIKNLKKKGTFKAKVKFAGNTYYNAVTKTVKIKIK